MQNRLPPSSRRSLTDCDRRRAKGSWSVLELWDRGLAQQRSQSRVSREVGALINQVPHAPTATAARTSRLWSDCRGKWHSAHPLGDAGGIYANVC